MDAKHDKKGNRVVVTDGDTELVYTVESWRDLHAGRTERQVEKLLAKQFEAERAEPDPLPGLS